MRGRGGGRARLLKREQTPNKLTPDCRHSSTVTSSTPSSFCSASLNTSSMMTRFDVEMKKKLQDRYIVMEHENCEGGCKARGVERRGEVQVAHPL
jgi:hypothetical protein